MPSPCFSFDMFWSFREISITCWSAKEWDDAVKEAQGQSSLCSLACVFLTDKQSGLGGHAENPEGCGNCFCQALLWESGSSSLPQHSRGGAYGTRVAIQEKRCWGDGPGSPHSATRKWCFLDREEERSTPESGRKMQGEPLPRALGVPLVCRLEGERGQSSSARAKVSRFLLWRESGMWKNGLGGQGRVWQESHWKNIQQDQTKSKVQTETCFLLLLWPFCPDQNNQTTLQDLKDETKLQEVRDSTGLGKSQTAEV